MQKEGYREGTAFDHQIGFAELDLEGPRKKRLDALLKAAEYK